MLDDVIDGAEHGGLAPLDEPACGQVFIPQGFQDRIGFAQHIFELPQELGARWALARCELGRAIPIDRFVADSADNPLPDVAREMQQQIPDAVRAFVAAGPDRGVRENINALPQLSRILFR
jgi:hypothetical protein